MQLVCIYSEWAFKVIYLPWIWSKHDKARVYRVKWGLVQANIFVTTKFDSNLRKCFVMLTAFLNWRVLRLRNNFKNILKHFSVIS